MYSVIFTLFLVFILTWKLTKLIKYKRLNRDYESLDQDLVIMLNEGDQVE
jgi:nitrogen fixation/metabolism regulation signal transduction histidine kinase